MTIIKCECTYGQPPGCCKGKGPAAYEAVRNKNKIKLCTRCILSKDKKEVILENVKADFDKYVTYDALGAIVLLAKLDE